MSARLPRLAVGSLMTLIAVGVLSAAAAANTVPPTRAGQSDTALLISQLTPAECTGMYLTRLQIGNSGSGSGGALILGTDDTETLNGGNGDDCIMAGGGWDTLNGQGGDDVLISGSGLFKWLNGGPGQDVCYRHGWLNFPTGCEVTP